MPERDLVTGSTTASATSVTEDADRAPSPRRGGRFTAAVVIAVVVLLGAIAVVLAAGSFASYASVKRHLDAFASDGDAEQSPAEFDSIVVRLRIAAAIAVLAAVAVYLGRRRLRRFLADLASETGAAIVALWRGLVAAVAAESRLHLATLGLVTVAAALVRLEFLFQPMRYDESVTYVHYASEPWYIALTTYTAPNNHVFHSLLVHLSTLAFGGEPWAIRLPAFVAGILLVPASYLAARALYGKHAALVGAALVAGSSMIVEYSTNARGYTLLALVFMLLLALATRLSTSWSVGEWLAFSLLAAVGFFTVPVMLYGLGAVALWLVLSFPSGQRRALVVRRLLPFLALGVALAGILYLPIAAASGLSSLTGNEFVEALPWHRFVDELPDSLWSTWRGWSRDLPLPVELVLTAAFLLALVLHRRLSRFTWPPAVAALAWIVPLVVAQRVVPFERVWLFLLPLYLITAAAGVVFALRPLTANTSREALVAVVLALVLSGAMAGTAVATQSVYDSEETSTFRDGDGVATLLTSMLQPGDKVLAWPPADAILEYQLGRRGLDPAAVLYWDEPGSARRLFFVVKEGPNNFTLPVLLTDTRLEGARLGPPRLVRRFDGASVYELNRIG